MSAKSRIEWTDKTWNPTRGCSIVSPGCVNCYAMKQAHRFSGPGRAYEGLTKLTRGSGPQWTGKVITVDAALLQPLSWRKPARVFVDSMSDLFHEDVPFDFVDRVWAVMMLAPRHRFQVLTKRADRMHAYLTTPGRYEAVLRAAAWVRDFRPELTSVGVSDPYLHPARWIELGVSTENQDEANRRIPWLLQTPAASHFISAEPLLGGLNLNAIRWDNGGMGGPAYVDVLRGTFSTIAGHGLPGPRLRWVIVGGESGSKARAVDLAWIRRIVQDCDDADVACFVKQLGAFPVSSSDEDLCGRRGRLVELRTDGPSVFRVQQHDPKGGDINEWPDDLRVRQSPKAA